MVARTEHPLDRLVQRDGGVFRKNEAGAVGASEQLGETLPRDEQVTGGADGEGVPGTTGVPGPQDGFAHRLRHAWGLGQGGRRVVEVYIRNGTGQIRTPAG